MENSNGRYRIIIICCVILILCLSGYITFAEVNESFQIKEVAQVSAIPEKSREEIIENNFLNYVKNIGNSMLLFDVDYNTYKEIGIDEGMEDSKIIIKNYDDYLLKDIISVEINYKGETYINILPNTNLYKQYGSKHKLKSNVLNAQIYSVGNGEYSYIYLINRDGTISYIDSSKLYENNLIEVVQIEGIKDIISLVQVNEFEKLKVMAIDIEGNMYNLSK